jgi:hypothetical protein
MHSIPRIPLRSVLLCGVALWALAVAWVVFRAWSSGIGRHEEFARPDSLLAEDFRRQAAGGFAVDRPVRAAARWLPDETRQPVG